MPVYEIFWSQITSTCSGTVQWSRYSWWEERETHNHHLSEDVTVLPASRSRGSLSSLSADVTVRAGSGVDGGRG